MNTTIQKTLRNAAAALLLLPAALMADTRFVSSNETGTITIVQGVGTPTELHRIARAAYEKAFPYANVGLTGGCPTGSYRAVGYNPIRRRFNFAYSTISQADANKKAKGSHPNEVRLWTEWTGRDNGSKRIQSAKLF